jgi:hypothetical protein
MGQNPRTKVPIAAATDGRNQALSVTDLRAWRPKNRGAIEIEANPNIAKMRWSLLVSTLKSMDAPRQGERADAARHVPPRASSMPPAIDHGPLPEARQIARADAVTRKPAGMMPALFIHAAAGAPTVPNSLKVFLTCE